jgi:hypothetical protein
MVDAAWGADVHERIYTPYGIVASGVTASVGAAVNVVLPSANTIAGDGNWHVGDLLKCPVGKSGWYNIFAHVNLGAGPAKGVPVRIRILRDGAFFAGQTGIVLDPAATTYLSVTTWLQINDGNEITIDCFTPAGSPMTYWQITRLSVIRTAHTIASSLLEAEAKPA